jgi:hypothetical protein
MTLNWSAAVSMQSGLDLLHRHTERRGAVTIDVDVNRRRRKIEIAGHVQEARRLRQRVFQACRGGVQLADVGVAQRILILRFADQPADGDDGTVLNVDVESRDSIELAAKFGHHLLYRGSLRTRFERDPERTLIRAPARAARSNRGHRAVDIGIAPQDRRRFSLMAAHLLERNAVGALGVSGKLAGILAWEKIFRHGTEKYDGRNQACREGPKDQGTM